MNYDGFQGALALAESDGSAVSGDASVSRRVSPPSRVRISSSITAVIATELCSITATPRAAPAATAARCAHFLSPTKFVTTTKIPGTCVPASRGKLTASSSATELWYAARRRRRQQVCAAIAGNCALRRFHFQCRQMLAQLGHADECQGTLRR
jgi:hypothetical protein